MSPRGRPSGRRPGDSGTREAIAAAASRQFAETGFDRTSLRSIAAEAGVDPALVTHFYGTKQQLFVAVAQLPVEPADVLPLLTEGDPGAVGERLARFIVGVLETEAGRRRIIGLIRAAATEPEAAAMLRRLMMEQVLGPLAEHLDVDRPRLRATLCGAQIVGVVMSRYVVAVEPLASTPADEVVAAIAPNLQRLLTEPLS